MPRSRLSRPGSRGSTEGAIMTARGTTRRDVVKSAAALAASAAFFPRPAIAQNPPRVVVVGGGFAGATVAGGLKKPDPRIAVTLVEVNRPFPACPFSNGVIAGLRDLSAQQFSYEKVAGDGIVLTVGTANVVDSAARSLIV